MECQLHQAPVDNQIEIQIDCCNRVTVESIMIDLVAQSGRHSLDEVPHEPDMVGGDEVWTAACCSRKTK